MACFFSESPLTKPSRPERLTDDSSGRCSGSSTSPRATHCPSATPSSVPCAGSREPPTKALSDTANARQQQDRGGASDQDNGEATSAIPTLATQTGITTQDEAARRRELALRQHAFFQLRLHLRRGANLVAMDRCGKSCA
ncbi:hypothetical protein QAD02_014205 [Eretmocerus hayati]|uniref:Uncharacterized protein n=1 Tax=Eretmocerus hayati TaxID=131215 RepID=A0ACC2P5L6_9HYME|nr:hypothetical protein QAD02_014205 [Eretmocerus hayati]